MIRKFKNQEKNLTRAINFLKDLDKNKHVLNKDQKEIFLRMRNAIFLYNVTNILKHLDTKK